MLKMISGQRPGCVANAPGGRIFFYFSIEKPRASRGEQAARESTPVRVLMPKRRAWMVGESFGRFVLCMQDQICECGKNTMYIHTPPIFL